MKKKFIVFTLLVLIFTFVLVFSACNKEEENVEFTISANQALQDNNVIEFVQQSTNIKKGNEGSFSLIVKEGYDLNFKVLVNNEEVKLSDAQKFVSDNGSEEKKVDDFSENDLLKTKRLLFNIKNVQKDLIVSVDAANIKVVALKYTVANDVFSYYDLYKIVTENEITSTEYEEINKKFHTKEVYQDERYYKKIEITNDAFTLNYGEKAVFVAKNDFVGSLYKNRESVIEINTNFEEKVNNTILIQNNNLVNKMHIDYKNSNADGSIKLTWYSTENKNFIYYEIANKQYSEFIFSLSDDLNDYFGSYIDLNKETPDLFVYELDFVSDYYNRVNSNSPILNNLILYINDTPYKVSENDNIDVAYQSELDKWFISFSKDLVDNLISDQNAIIDGEEVAAKSGYATMRVDLDYENLNAKKFVMNASQKDQDMMSFILIHEGNEYKPVYNGDYAYFMIFSSSDVVYGKVNCDIHYYYDYQNANFFYKINNGYAYNLKHSVFTYYEDLKGLIMLDQKAIEPNKATRTEIEKDRVSVEQFKAVMGDNVIYENGEIYIEYNNKGTEEEYDDDTYVYFKYKDYYCRYKEAEELGELEYILQVSGEYQAIRSGIFIYNDDFNPYGTRFSVDVQLTNGDTFEYGVTGLVKLENKKPIRFNLEETFNNIGKFYILKDINNTTEIKDMYPNENNYYKIDSISACEGIEIDLTKENTMYILTPQINYVNYQVNSNNFDGSLLDYDMYELCYVKIDGVNYFLHKIDFSNIRDYFIYRENHPRILDVSIYLI